MRGPRAGSEPEIGAKPRMPEDICVGLDIGGTNIKVGLVALDAQDGAAAPAARIIARRRLSVAAFSSPFELVEGCCTAVDGLLGEAGLEGGRRRLGGIGVSICGYVMPDGLPELTNVPYLDGFPLVSRLRERYGVPVTMDNDANAAALAEHAFGAGRGAKRLVLVAVGTGIGLGVIIDGRLVRFCGGTTGNIGHAVVDPVSPERCGLGCRGCLETKSTAPALEREANRVARENPGSVLGRLLAGSAGARVTVSEVKAAADAGDDTALGLLAEAGRWLGIGLATFAATFSPDVILLGGGMAEMGPALIGAAIEAFEDTGMPYVKRGVRVVPAALGNDAAMIGAVCGLSRSRFLWTPSS